MNYLNLTKLLEKNQDKIITTIAFGLVFFLAFAMGRLSMRQKLDPISLEGFSIYKTAGESTNSDSDDYSFNKIDKTEGRFVGSRNSNKYHLPECQWAKNIKPENQIWFKNEEEARKMGYSPSNCVKQGL